MNEHVEKAATGGDFIIWIIMFTILIVVVAYLAWINKDIER
ncbi:hypothetical protein [Sulfurimonas sp.]|nr:hypothetical protein [Sulfurimonas sp.]